MKGENMTTVERFDVRILEEVVRNQSSVSPNVSYTAKILTKGIGECAKKLGEEGVELALAAVSGSREQVVYESADVIYHLFVILYARGIAFSDVESELQKRRAKSGLEEKASRRI